MIPMRNSAVHYGKVSIALHWLGAAAVVAMLATALPIYLHAGEMERQVGWMRVHGALGTLLLLLLAVRIVWHFLERQPDKFGDNPALNRLASAVHASLLILIGVQLVTGPLNVWSGGFAIDIFGWAEIPSPFGEKPLPWHDAIGAVHVWSGRIVAAIVLLHLAGVAKHLLYDGDDTLPRMLGMTGSER